MQEFLLYNISILISVSFSRHVTLHLHSMAVGRGSPVCAKDMSVCRDSRCAKSEHESLTKPSPSFVQLSFIYICVFLNEEYIYVRCSVSDLRFLIVSFKMVLFKTYSGTLMNWIV